MPERWRLHPELPIFISDLGRIARSDQEIPPTAVLATRRAGKAYPRPRVCLKGKRLMVGRLVLEAWVSACPRPGWVARSLDGDPQNVTLSNLAWGPPARGGGGRRRVLAGAKAAIVILLVHDGVRVADVAERARVSRATVYRTLQRARSVHGSAGEDQPGAP